ncbi:serine/threonine-protein kinase ark1-like [Haliotis rufescens]|uniref:serine/threonine-protein kinase ark1-like n=1 Tax=Haliotis rufescens TaxID=6454 RepID=UPI00201E908E|nr:serine/threonine-protein kinase ark1-like [Haliotis rufescens]
MSGRELVPGRFSRGHKENIGIEMVFKKVLVCSHCHAAAEKDILRQCLGSEGAKNIVKMIGDSFTEDCFTLTFEYCEEGSLDQYVSKRLTMKSPLDEADCRSVVTDIASGLQFLHKIGIIHGNIQPENILVTWDSGTLYKIGGFGSAARRLTREHAGEEGTGDTCFSPPEAVLTEKSDIFSLGVIAFALLRQEFDHNKLVAYYNGRRLAKVGGEIKLPGVADQGFGDCIKAALRQDISRRPTAEEVYLTLNTSNWWCKWAFLGVCVVAGVAMYDLLKGEEPVSQMLSRSSKNFYF